MNGSLKIYQRNRNSQSCIKIRYFAFWLRPVGA